MDSMKWAVWAFVLGISTLWFLIMPILVNTNSVSKPVCLPNLCNLTKIGDNCHRILMRNPDINCRIDNFLCRNKQITPTVCYIRNGDHYCLLTSNYDECTYTYFPTSYILWPTIGSIMIFMEILFTCYLCSSC